MFSLEEVLPHSKYRSIVKLTIISQADEQPEMFQKEHVQESDVNKCNHELQMENEPHFLTRGKNKETNKHKNLWGGGEGELAN